MKKLLTFAAVAILAAATTQAATIKWSSGKLYTPNTSVDKTDPNYGKFTSTTVGTSVDAVILLVSASDYATYSAMDSQALYKSYLDDKITYTEKKTGKTSSMGSASAITTSAEFAKGASGYAVAIYTLQAAGETFFIATTGYDTINDAGTQSNLGSTNLASSKGGWQTVPEPTTVALLALGLVAAGLKRKVA